MNGFYIYDAPDDARVPNPGGARSRHLYVRELFEPFSTVQFAALSVI